MAVRLENAVSPYLQSHADNPVDWWPWGEEAFAEAARRDVPVMISIGYATCHWCHVMARETFSDPEVGAWLAERVVSIKVDREEHPDVDAAYMTAAGAFSDQLGWPLTVFATPQGRVFYAATYLPPQPISGVPSFRQVVDAVLEAWTSRREEVLQSADGLRDAITAASRRDPGALPNADAFAEIVAELAGFEDQLHGGFGGAPKFPVAPALLFLQARGSAGDADADALAARTLQRIAASDLRDPVEGGFFRYATRRDWSEPHYERMLNDNALLLEVAARAGARETAAGVVGFLREILRVSGGLASGQDSESLIDGERSEGGYYALPAAARAEHPPPALDAKVLTGWNGLAIGALAVASRLLDEPEWAAFAAGLADELVAAHLTRVDDGSDDDGAPRLLRASRDGRPSTARAALEDYGDLAVGLLELAITTGEHRYATVARELVDACLVAGDREAVASGRPITAAVPGGGDPVLAAQGLAAGEDPNEGSAPSGEAAIARAAFLLHQLTAEPRYRFSADALVAALAPLARQRPMAFGATLAVASALAAPARQLVVVRPDGAAPGELEARARGPQREGTLAIALTASAASAWAGAGFALLDDRQPQGSASTAFACTDFVCRLPVASVAELDADG
ncbi:thioredoxin domain-containing protein [Yonghaparkia sp. Soil809]|uniref:thioredoxin domain-containing protein n=1 Tax=Yonghaparkia sp. Soil809 TaxID=1736417 RepID=UPI0006FC8D00|nr:DUF255 domain-containing protein [Yonghaparkia sp. Soil809]KRF32898.1 hypothetical protein ASG83_02430 [Yonghaparkia sp. Soil809]